ncbi:MAG: hypothetical protein Q8L73_10390 [Methylotenera sp.]|nr:hypothetical protein [Methylotenera sp.]
MVNSNENSINSLLGFFLEETLTNCSHVLAFIEFYTIEDVPSFAEKQGLSLIHSTVRKALNFEIERAKQLRKASND